MKILLVNKFASLSGTVGGATRYILELYELLRIRGHEVSFFSMKQEEAPNSMDWSVGKELFEKWGKYWVSPIETQEKNTGFGWQAIRTFCRFLWSFQAAKKLGRMMQDFRPDLVHLNSISHQISPSIIPVIKREGIPIVMTVHDYFLLYPDYSLKSDQVEDLRHQRFFSILKKRQIQDSWRASFLAWLEFKLHRLLGVYHSVNAYISPSKFMKSLVERAGFPNVSFLPNFIALNGLDDPRFQQQEEETIVCFGRITPYKGVMELLEAYALCIKRGVLMPPLVLCGNGMENEVKALIKTHSMEGRVTQIPFQGKEPQEEYARARFAVVPSFPYLENFPYSVLNAFAYGKPVVSSGLGGLGEMVLEGETGWNVLGADEDVSREQYIDLLSRVLEKAATAPLKELKQMGKRARSYVEKLNQEWYYGELMKIYGRVLRGSPNDKAQMSNQAQSSNFKT